MPDEKLKLWVEQNKDWLKGRDLTSGANQRTILYRMQMDRIVKWHLNEEDFDFNQIDQILKEQEKNGDN